jgi:hypothetical protein
METKLYLLTLTGPCDYDQFDAFVVRATSVEHARQIAQAVTATEASEQGDAFGCAEGSQCVEINGASGDVGVVIGSFNAA